MHHFVLFLKLKDPYIINYLDIISWDRFNLPFPTIYLVVFYLLEDKLCKMKKKKL